MLRQTIHPGDHIRTRYCHRDVHGRVDRIIAGSEPSPLSLSRDLLCVVELGTDPVRLVLRRLSELRLVEGEK